MTNTLTSRLKKKKKGFTLIELIIVMAIIAILAAIAVPRFLNVRQDANLRADIANGKTIEDAVTVLLTQNDITLNATGNTTIDLPSTAPATPSANYTAVANFLQNVPAARGANNQNFVVTITQDHQVTITVNNVQVAPTPAGVYAAVQ